MHSDDLIILKGLEIGSLLAGREQEILSVVRQAYRAHAEIGKSSLPHSVFLRFPDNPENRIIALPAYLGDGFGIAGLKWIASFPANVKAGKDRASGVLILSSAQTGVPEAIMEASIISAKRTAASAALAAQCLYQDREETQAGIIGCGLINFEVARFLRAVFPGLKKFRILDKEQERAASFKHKLQTVLGIGEVTTTNHVDSILSECRLVSIATTAIKPHIADLSMCKPDTVILHVSLRDIAPEAVLRCHNIVDDVDHVCRAETSVHLAEQLSGSRGFIKGTLADVFSGTPSAMPAGGKTSLFSPFGLGILDLAVGKLVHDLAMNENRGLVLKSFLPNPWAAQQVSA